jgi:ATP-binding protein involved in chromosome partitioning
MMEIDRSVVEPYLQGEYCFYRMSDPASPSSSSSRPGAAPPEPEDVRRALTAVVDPELHVGIVELGMVDDIRVTPDGHVTVKVALTTAGCPLRAHLQREVDGRVRAMPGVSDVSVEYGEMTQEQRSAAMQRARWQARESAEPTEVPAETRVVAIASGKGGVGKSSVTANLAAALASRGLVVGVLDADIWGFSLPRMLGVSGRLGGAERKIHPHEIEVPRASGDGPPGRLKVISMGFLVEDEASALMWRGLILTKAVEQFLTDVRWGTMDYLLVDLPPGTGDIQMGLARMLPQSELLVVTTPALAAQKVASRVADMARRSYLRVLGVVENMSVFVAPDGQEHHVFGEGGGAALAEEIGVPLVARIPLEPAVSLGGDTGHPVALDAASSPAGAAFHALAARVVDELAPPIEMTGCTARILELASELAQR